MGDERWREFFALLQRGDLKQLRTIRTRLVAALDRTALSADGDLLRDLRRMKRHLEDEIASRGLFA